MILFNRFGTKKPFSAYGLAILVIKNTVEIPDGPHLNYVCVRAAVSSVPIQITIFSEVCTTY